MHEASLAMEIVLTLEAHADQLERITAITLDIGSLSCVEPQALRTALETALTGTLADGAVIHMAQQAALAHCQDCGTQWSPPDRIEPCPQCGSFRKTWLAGQDMKIRAIEGWARPSNITAST